MINLIFSDTEFKALEVERFTYPHFRVQRRMEAIYLKSMGLEHGLILKICRISEPTLVRYLRAYEKEGLAEFTNDEYINAPSVCKLLNQVAEFYGFSIPITIFLDNAKYQHCQLVCNHAKMLLD